MKNWPEIISKPPFSVTQNMPPVFSVPSIFAL
jgi:hypothetical protein